ARGAAERALARVAPEPAAAKPARTKAWWIMRVTAAAAAVFLAAGAGWWVAAPAEAVASIVNAQNCQWSEGRAPEDTLRAGSVLALDQGLVEVRFRSGATVVLEGPAVFELRGPNAGRLQHGKLTARVPEAAKGFAVLSPQGKIIDLGTEF